jgi:hypothetical protein
VGHKASEGSVALLDDLSLKDLANDQISNEKDDEQDDEWNFIYLVLPTIIWGSLRRAKAIQELVFTLLRGQNSIPSSTRSHIMHYETNDRSIQQTSRKEQKDWRSSMKTLPVPKHCLDRKCMHRGEWETKSCLSVY